MFPLNVAASRLVIGIIPGLEISVLNETDGLIARLYSWAEEAKEPLMSYATAILAVAMDVQEVQADPDNRWDTGDCENFLLEYIVTIFLTWGSFYPLKIALQKSFFYSIFSPCLSRTTSKRGKLRPYLESVASNYLR